MVLNGYDVVNLTAGKFLYSTLARSSRNGRDSSNVLAATKVPVASLLQYKPLGWPRKS